MGLMPFPISGARKITGCNKLASKESLGCDIKAPMKNKMVQTQLLHLLLRGAITLTILCRLAISLPNKTFAAPTDPRADNEASFTELTLYPNIATVGVFVNGVDLPQTAQLLYRESNQTDWQIGHPLIRIETGALVSSLFNLLPETTYEIKVRSGENEISASTTTQPLELHFTPSRVLHVKRDALVGGDGSATKPFNMIQDALDQATPGTQVLVADGVYKEELSFPNSGTDNNWIQLKAAGSGAILDGSRTIYGDVWSAEGRANVWRKQLDGYGFFAYLARDGQRYFQYKGLGDLRKDIGGEGWFLDPDTMRLYVRSRTDPATHTWQVPFLNQAIRADGQSWLWIEGFEMRYYGTGLSAMGIYARNASHVVIRHNNIHNIRYGIFIDWTRGNTEGNHTRIEYNDISDAPVNEWSWAQTKGTSMEGTAIVLKGHIGAIVHSNKIHNFFNGFYTGSSADRSNVELAFDIDVYNNHIYAISDDALEPEGACVNHRFRNNTIDDAFVGVSLAPVSIGPTWVLNNTIANYTGRGIKWDRNSDGFALIYQNTFWTAEKDIAAMDFISPVKNGIIYNNIFQNTSYSVYEVEVGSTGHNWNHNNWFTSHNPDFLWEDIVYANIEKLCAAKGLDCNSHDEDPDLKNPGAGDFTLLESSPNIDRGVGIPGINDNFVGDAPDIGAYEFGHELIPPTVLAILREDPNPTSANNVNYTLMFSEPVAGLNLSPPFDDLELATSRSTSDASIISVIPISASRYSVTIDTGSGSGDIRLDVADDNSITNVAGTPLGGTQPGDGDFTTGDRYTINRTIPATVTPTATVAAPIVPIQTDTEVETTTTSITSSGKQDGWVLETEEDSGQGGETNSKTLLVVGDNADNAQYRSILHLPTKPLPNNIVITDLMLMLKKHDSTSDDLFSTHGNIVVDVQYGAFGNWGPFPIKGLQSMDFQSEACKDAVGVIQAEPMGEWYWAIFDRSAIECINLRGITQLRLRFETDDDNDAADDYIRFFSGDAANLADRPYLIIVYQEE